MEHVVLSGATGFLGSYILQALIKEGYYVTILKRTTSDTWRIKHLLDKVTVINVDNCSIDEAFAYRDVSVIIHTACDYGRAGQSISETIKTNILFGLDLLSSACKHNVKYFVNTGSLLPKAINPYSLSKSHFVDWLKYRSNEINVINLNLEHMYGPNDDGSKLVPWLISNLENNVERISLTEGTQSRDFIYIDDVVNAYLIVLLSKETFSNFIEFDVGTGHLTPVREFITKIKNEFHTFHPENTTILGFGDKAMRDGEMLDIQVNVEPLKALGWSARYTVDMGVRKLMREAS